MLHFIPQPHMKKKEVEMVDDEETVSLHMCSIIYYHVVKVIQGCK